MGENNMVVKFKVRVEFRVIRAKIRIIRVEN